MTATQTQQKVGQGVSLAVDGDILTITVDMTQDFGPSASGKTIKVASSCGNVDVPGFPGHKLGLNIYRYR